MPKTFNDLWTSLDLPRVHTEMAAHRRMEFEFNAAVDCVAALAQQYLEDDAAQEIIGVEQEYLIEDGPLEGHHGFIDLILRRGPVYTIVDWKSTGSLAWDAKRKFVDRCRHSWQTRYYDLALRHMLKLPEETLVEVEYRGISVGDKEQVKVQGITSGEWRAKAEDRFVKIRKAIDLALDSSNYESGYGETTFVAAPWPQNSPRACFAYNDPCPYISSCLLDTTVIPSEMPKVKTLSHSSMNLFLECPERFRREKLDKASGEDEFSGSVSTEMGHAIHRGMAEIYRQVKEGR